MASRLVDEAALAAWGAEFARALRPQAVVGISGALGTGKTTLIRAIALGLGVTEPVTSPTFALVHRYTGTAITIYHVDAYRLARPREALDLGLDDMLREPDRVMLIEWPERLGAACPPLTHRVTLAYAGDPSLRELDVQ